MASLDSDKEHANSEKERSSQMHHLKNKNKKKSG